MLHVLKSRYFAVLLGLTFLVLDQGGKVLALMHLHAQRFKFGSSAAWLDIVPTLTPSAFLNLGTRLTPGLKQPIVVLGIGVALCWAAGWAIKCWKRSTARAAATYFIALGGTSNLADRVFREGHVVDYLALNLGSLRTGAFNMADVAMMLGAVALLGAGFKKRH